MDLLINGLLSSLVAVTGGCGYIEPWAAVVIGMLSIPTYVISKNFVLKWLKVDDALTASSVHGTCGILGCLWVGLADTTSGLFYTGNLRLLGVQALGCIAIYAWITCIHICR